MIEPNHSKFNVLVFDSGVGGLSIAEQIQQAMPLLPLTYVGDTGFFPYGLKDADELSDRITALITKLFDKLAPDLIVIACNTASTLVLDRLRQILSIPIVGVVPAIKPAARDSKTKAIGLLATQATVSRQYTHDLVKNYASDCQVVYVGAPRLVEVAESKLNGETLNEASIHELRQVLLPFIDGTTRQPVDAIVLGCTHFPLIKSELKAAIPEFQGLWIDSAKAIANRVAFLLQEREVDREQTGADALQTHSLKTNHQQTYNKAYWSHNCDFAPGFVDELKQRGFECCSLASIIDDEAEMVISTKK